MRAPAAALLPLLLAACAGALAQRGSPSAGWADAADFAALSPAQAASSLRACMSHHGVLSRESEGARSEWAGRLVASRGGAVVVGPLVPKAGSTTLRARMGHKDRPRGLQHPSVPKPERAFQLAAVRNPLRHFIDGYKQAGTWLPEGATSRDKRERGQVELYCGMSDYERRAAFGRDARRVMRQGWGARVGVDPHRVRQLWWFQNYGGVPVVDRVDALVRLERWDEDWALATEQAGHFSAAAQQWMQEQGGVINSRRHVALDDDPLVEWQPLCGENGTAMWFSRAEGTDPEGHPVYLDGERKEHSTRRAIEVLRHHYALRYVRDHLLELCRFLALDFACLRYPLPEECQLIDYQHEGS